MQRINKNQYYLYVAKAISARSTCLKRQYGCVIVKNDEIIATGYNGSARGMVNCCDHMDECPRRNIPSNGNNYDDCHSVHAEQNAIISASRSEMLNATMYIYGRQYDYDEKRWKPIENIEPCQICRRMIANAGIQCLIVPQITSDTEPEDPHDIVEASVPIY